MRLLFSSTSANSAARSSLRGSSGCFGGAGSDIRRCPLDQERPGPRLPAGKLRIYRPASRRASPWFTRLRRAGAALLVLVIAGLCGCVTPPYSGYCPDGMALVGPGKFRYGDKAVTGRRTQEEIGAYCIDIYEYPNREGARPKTGVTWLEAAAICRERGKRLCTEYEWEKAARGPRGWRYPWGNTFDPSACALDPDAPGEHLSGARPRCRSPYGVYDMAGSVWEWTQNSWEGDASKRVVRGGWERTLGEKGARASYRAAEDASRSSPRIGFRCCAPARSGLHTTRDVGRGP